MTAGPLPAAPKPPADVTGWLEGGEREPVGYLKAAGGTPRTIWWLVGVSLVLADILMVLVLVAAVTFGTALSNLRGQPTGPAWNQPPLPSCTTLPDGTEQCQ